MDDRDFLDSLSAGRFPSKEAGEYFSELRKSASEGGLVSKGVREVGQFIGNRKIPLLASLIGASSAAALEYMANKSKDGKPSLNRQRAESNLAAHDQAKQKADAEGKEQGYNEQMGHAAARSAADVSKITEKHPARGALLAAPAGAAIGYGLGALGRRILG